MWNEPMLDSTVVVAVRTLPSRSTIVNWFVPCSIGAVDPQRHRPEIARLPPFPC